MIGIIGATLFARLAQGLRGAGVALGLSLVAVPVCLAAPATESAWTKEPYSKVRLVSGAIAGQDGPKILAGVQIRLSPRWKTYWRSPGDSGVPPTFDWSGSKNLKQAKVLYPAPHRFADASGTAIGYSDEVVFPVEITPERPGEPVELKLNVNYGLCETLCIPNDASLSLEIPAELASGQGNALLLQSYLALVPRPVEPGKLPAIDSTEAKLAGDKPHLLIEARFPPGSVGADLFVEAPDIFVPVPKPMGQPEDGKQRFVVSFVSEAEAAEIKGKPLTLTLVSDQGAREASWTVE
ncbi:MAG: protein-disulfide reductase DsbD domain-containing protein [Methyloceanibacter sp.]